VKFAIDISIGRTSTDGSFIGNGQTEVTKVNTKPDDLLTGLVHCINEGAGKYGLPAREMLMQTDTLKLSTFVATDVVNRKKGPKLGLIMTKGFKNGLYEAKIGTPISNLILSNMIEEIEEEVDSFGNQTNPPREEEVKSVVRHLLERGVQNIVVSLHRSWLNPANEERIRVIIRQDYPAHYMGAMPIFLSTEVSTTQQDYVKRTSMTLLNAYLQKAMANHLREVAEALRELGYNKPLLIVNSDGEATTLAKTMASDIYSLSAAKRS